MKLLNFRLTDNVHWLVDDIKNHMKSLKKVDSQIHETGNEGCDHRKPILYVCLIGFLWYHGVERNISKCMG